MTSNVYILVLNRFLALIMYQTHLILLLVLQHNIIKAASIAALQESHTFPCRSLLSSTSVHDDTQVFNTLSYFSGLLASVDVLQWQRTTKALQTLLMCLALCHPHNSIYQINSHQIPAFTSYCFYRLVFVIIAFDWLNQVLFIRI